mmetsp:Transcript_28578/g.85135  ORF Transcript_28578/g.85135 Transcript_28578/m.85135 type:complete len:153 (+) Transcript_28578:69-527(+)
MLQNNPPNAGSFRYKTGHTLKVSGLAATTRKTDVQGAFGDFGQILRIDMEPGRAFVEFEDERDAMDAMSEMDGKKLQDRRVKVERSGLKEVSTNTPRHGAKGVHTADRHGQSMIEARCSENVILARTAAMRATRSRSRSRHRSGTGRRERGR